MTWLLRLLLIPFLAVPVLIVGTAPPAAACSCEQIDPELVPEWTGPVFVATLVEDVPDGASDVELDAVVTHVYQGEVPGEVVVETSTEGTACGLTGLEAGQTFLFSQDLDGDVVHASSCGGPDTATDEVLAEAERDYGPGVSREVSDGALEPRTGRRGGGETTGDADRAALMAAGGFAVLVLVLGGGVYLARTRRPATARS